MLTRSQIEEGTKTKFSKTLHHILNDLGFKGELKKLFFPNVSKKFVEFRNQVSEMNELAIDTIKLDDQLQNLKRYPLEPGARRIKLLSDNPPEFPKERVRNDKK